MLSYNGKKENAKQYVKGVIENNVLILHGTISPNKILSIEISNKLNSESKYSIDTTINIPTRLDGYFVYDEFTVSNSDKEIIAKVTWEEQKNKYYSIKQTIKKSKSDEKRNSN